MEMWAIHMQMLQLSSLMLCCSPEHHIFPPESWADFRTFSRITDDCFRALWVFRNIYKSSIWFSQNINFNNGTACTPESYTFHLSRIYFNLNPFGHDLQHCGTNHLPTESSIMSGGSCRVSISGFQKNTKLDIGVADQEVVRDKLANILSCVWSIASSIFTIEWSIFSRKNVPTNRYQRN